MFSWIIDARKDKWPAWYTTAGVVAVSLIIWGLFEQIYALSVVVIIFAGVYVLVENNSPDHFEVEIDANGIRIGGDFYEFARIETFAIVYERSTPVYLRIRLRDRGFRILDIDFPNNIEASELRAWLGGYIVEDAKSDISWAERLTKWLKI